VEDYVKGPRRMMGLPSTCPPLMLPIVGTVVLAYLTELKLTGEAIGHRPLLTLGVLLVVVGAQLVSLGLVSELVASHHEERMGGRTAELHVDEILR
jgi:hypothetical protein